MARFSYGVQTALSYIVNHFFYNSVHYVYLSSEYYPYRRKNPRSSSPHRIYEDIYEPWKDRDEFSKVIAQNRINIRNGIIAKQNSGVIDLTLASKLGKVCNEIDVKYFYPIIYRVDLESILPKSRIVRAGSGLVGSMEFLIPELQEVEIDELLFNDYVGNKFINQFVRREFQYYRKHGRHSIDSGTFLTKLLGLIT